MFYASINHFILFIFTMNVFMTPVAHALNNNNSELILPTLSEKEAIENDEKFKEIQSRKCGHFIILDKPVNENLETDDESPHPLDLQCSVEQVEMPIYSRNQPWKTKGAKTRIYISKEIKKTIKDSEEALDYVFADEIIKRARVHFDKDAAWARDDSNPNVKERLKKFEDELFLKDKESPKTMIRKILAFYPDIEDELLKESPSYAPLICRYEAWNHRQIFFKRLANALGWVTTAGSIIGLFATAFISIPAIPVFLWIAGGVKSSVGALKIKNSVAGWNDVRAGRVAKDALKFFDELENQIETLDKERIRLEKNINKGEVNPQSQYGSLEQVKAKIIDLKNHLPSREHRKQLKSAIKNKNKNFKDFLTGVLDIGIGSTMIWGGFVTNEALKTFDASNTTINTIGNPNTGSGGDEPGGGGNWGNNDNGFNGSDDGG